jgi:hypothetical protein
MSFLEQDRPTLRTISTNTGIAEVPVNGHASVGLFIALAGVTGGLFVFETSIDGNTWVPASGLRTNGQLLENNTGAISATPAFGYVFDVAGANFFRVRATAGSFGVANCTFAVSGVLKNFYELGTTKPFSHGDFDFRYVAAADATPFNATAPTQLIAASATYRNYVTGLQAINVGATATEFVIQDQTPTTMFRTLLPALMTVPVSFQFPTPLRSGVAAASRIDARCVTSGASIHLSLQGFTGP